MFEARFDVSLWHFGFKETELKSLMTAAAPQGIGCKLLKPRMLSMRSARVGWVAYIGVTCGQIESESLSCLFSLPYDGDISGRPGSYQDVPVPVIDAERARRVGSLHWGHLRTD
jgi:hypothetical protein